MKKIRFLADVNVEKRIVDYLRRKDFDTKWLPDFDPMLTDNELLKLANSEHRILLANDKDFGELVFFQKKVAVGIILFRVRGHDAEQKVSRLESLLRDHVDKLLNHFAVLTQDTIRIVPLEDPR